MSIRTVLVGVLVFSWGNVWAQTPTEVSVPPMVPATPPPMPPAEPVAQPTPPAGTIGTPPPPGSPVQQSRPGYSPYGQPRSQEKPAPEIGLMVSESLFGSLTAAGVTVLPYFLLFANGTLGDPTISSVIFALIFGAAPLAVAQTQTSLANGSRYYQTEMWIPALTGLAGTAGVLGIYALTGWLPTGRASGGVPNGGSVAWLMIGSIGVVPLLQMAAINLFKQPKFGMTFALGDPAKKGGVVFAPPALAPVISQDNGNASVGAQLSLLRGFW